MSHKPVGLLNDVVQSCLDNRQLPKNDARLCSHRRTDYAKPLRPVQQISHGDEFEVFEGMVRTVRTVDIDISLNWVRYSLYSGRERRPEQVWGPQTRGALLPGRSGAPLSGEPAALWPGRIWGWSR